MNFYYDIIIKGTSIPDCILARNNNNNNKNKKILIIDTKSTYGNHLTHMNCIIDNIPKLIRKTDPIIKMLIDMNVHIFLDFIEIKHHLYFKLENIGYVMYKVPTSKTQIANCEYLEPAEKFLCNRFLSGKICADKLPDKIVTMFTKAICGNKMNKDALLRFVSSFNDYYFIYPVYGLKDISEQISRCNAVNGVEYLLNDDIEIKENENNGVSIKSVYGTFNSSLYIKGSITKRDSRIIKVLNIKHIFYENGFYGVFDDGVDLINCICLNSETKVCPKDTFLIYLWKVEGDVTNLDVGKIGIEKEWILFSLDVECNEDFSYDVIIEDKYN